jgi:hypothetical protein
MRIKKTPSTYSQKRGTSNVTDFVAERSARSYRVDFSEGKLGQELKLTVPHKDAPGGEKSIDISFLLEFPMLWEPFSEAVSTSARIAASPLVTVSGRCMHLKNGFISYLRVAAPNAALGDITTNLFEGFIVWLRRTENGALKYKKMSRQHFEMTISQILKYLLSTHKWKQQLSPELDLRNNYWRDEPDDRKHIEIIPDEIYRAIYVSCKKEIAATMDKVRHQRAVMQEKISHPIALRGDIFPSHAYHASGLFNAKVWKDNPYKDMGVCLAALRHRTPGVILSITELYKMQDKMLLRAIEENRFFGGISTIHSCFYPYARELVPFALMLAIHLDYNPETLLRSVLSNYVIRKNEVGSIELVASPANINHEKREKLDEADQAQGAELEILARAKKGRSNNAEQPQIRPATDDPDNPASIVKFLEEWTSFIRPLAPPAARDRLLLYVTEQRDRAIRPFAGTSTASNDKNWRNSLKRFYKDHGLPHTAFNRFRTTGLDVTDALFGGDIRAKQAAGNHASPETTYRMYSTSAHKQRGDEFLGQVGQLRKRWRESNGKVDPRNRPNSSDVGSATPGWTCADPFSGPFTPNKLCASYGSCPACPHASIALDDPYACAQAWNLLNAIDDAASEIAPYAWLKRWSPIKKKLLEVWLPRFPGSVLAQAKTMTLAKLPPLE